MKQIDILIPSEKLYFSEGQFSFLSRFVKEDGVLKLYGSGISPRGVEISCTERYVFTKEELLAFIQNDSAYFLKEEKKKRVFVEGEILTFRPYGTVVGKYKERLQDVIKIEVISDSSGLGEIGRDWFGNIDYLVL